MNFTHRLIVLAFGTALVAWPAWAQDVATDPAMEPNPPLEDVDIGNDGGSDAGDGADIDMGDGMDVTDIPDTVESQTPIAMTPPGLAMHGINLSSVSDISLPPGLEQQGKIPPGHALQAIGFSGPPVGGAGLGAGGSGIDPASLAGGPGRGNAFGRNR